MFWEMAESFTDARMVRVRYFVALAAVLLLASDRHEAKGKAEEAAKGGGANDILAQWDADAASPAPAAEPAGRPAAPAAERPAQPDAPAPEPVARQAAPVEVGDGRLIRVRLPLSGNADAHIKSAIQRVVGQLTRGPQQANR